MRKKPSMTIAIDGTSGSGKSSTSRGVAEALRLRYLDTGAQYRAMALAMLRTGIDVHDVTAVAAFADTPRLLTGTDPLKPTIYLNDEDVTVEIRSEAVTAAVSQVATVPAVRERLLHIQRRMIGAGGIVVEGRDIGSVVAPEAKVKVFLSADLSARAARRAAEAGGDAARTEADLCRRDEIDSTREAAPLVIPDGATHVDTTYDSLDHVIAKVVALAWAAAKTGDLRV